MKFSMLALSAAMAVQVSSSVALAQASRQEPRQPPRPTAPAAPAQPAMDPAMQELLQKGAPSKEHDLLKPMAGKWEVKGSFWMDPAAPPMESVAKATSEWMLGGRQMKMTYTGDFFGTPFEGMSLTGFNRVSGQFESLWVDSLSTGMTIGFGSVSADGKTFTFHSEHDDPMTGSRKKTREVIVIESNDKHTLTAYEILPNGADQKTMVLVFTRAKN